MGCRMGNHAHNGPASTRTRFRAGATWVCERAMSNFGYRPVPRPPSIPAAGRGAPRLRLRQWGWPLLGSAVLLKVRHSARLFGDPAPKGLDFGTGRDRLWEDQVPSLVDRHAQGERSHQPTSSEVMFHEGPAAQRDPKSVDRGLQRQRVRIEAPPCVPMQGGAAAASSQIFQSLGAVEACNSV